MICRASGFHPVRSASAAAAPSPLRLRAQSPLPNCTPYRERVEASASARLRTSVGRQGQRCRGGVAQALGNPTSPGTGEVASLSEPERALSRGAGDEPTDSGAIGNPR